MKRLLAIAIASMAAGLLADSVVWTGHGDGRSWKDLSNWELEATGEAPGSVPLSTENSGDQIVISGAGVEVEYDAGDPWIGAGESLAIVGGAKLTQTVASWWHGADGTVTIDGGTFDTGSCSGTHAWSSFAVENGGTLIARTPIPDANVSVDETSAYEVVSAQGHTYSGTEKFTRFAATGQNVELAIPSAALSVSNDVTWYVKLVSAAALSVSWKSGSLVTWDTSFGGYYNAGGTIDIAEGWSGSFTFAYAPSSVFASCFQGKITYNGTALTAESFGELFDVEATTVTDPSGTEHPASRVSLATVSDWKLGAISATDISASGATLSTTVESTGAGGFSVYVACDTRAIAEADVLSAGEVVPESAGVYSKAYSGLEENTVYNYAFAIVTNGAVAVFKSGTFIASDYGYIYSNGWVGGMAPANLPASVDSVLFLSDFAAGGEMRLDNKRVVDSTLTAGTMLYGTMDVVNSAVVNTRKNMLNQAPYGFYGDLAVPLNFISRSGNGTIRRSCSYTFRAVDGQLSAFYDNVIAAGKIKAGGETITASDYARGFTLETAAQTETDSFDFGDGNGAVEATLKVSMLAMWDEFPETASGDWTVQPGARVKLTKNAKLGRLTVVDSSDVKIDLNGYRLTVAALGVDGAKVRGEFAAGDLPMLVGEGVLVAVGRGTMIFFR